MKPKEALVIHIDVSWRFLVVLGLLAGVLAVGYSAASAQADAGSAGPLSASGAAEITAASTGSRHFYLTKAHFYPSEVLGACGTGYHMASLWEILDVSNLTYDTTHPSAANKDDSGYGPPSSYNGWVRTGYNSSVAEFTGTGNCQNWTSDAATDYGANVRLNSYWEISGNDMVAWDASPFPCNYPWSVWCVRN